jgi:hypothetical protein
VKTCQLHILCREFCFWPDSSVAAAATPSGASPGVSSCLAGHSLAGSFGVGGADAPSFVPLAAWSTGPVTSICRHSCFLHGSIFGTIMVSTPFFTSAVILSRSTFFGSLNLRTKCPQAHSTTCQLSPSKRHSKRPAHWHQYFHPMKLIEP